MDLFTSIGSYLGKIDNLRLEWSLKLTPASVTPRLAPLFWIPNDRDRDMRPRYAQVHALLLQLDCPAELLSAHEALSPLSTTQGLLVSLEEGSAKRTLYIQHRDPVDGTLQRVGLKWENGTFLEENSYEFHSFKSSGDKEDLLGLLHPEHRSTAALLLREPLLDQSGYYLQKTGNRINEVYITYPWHPHLSSIQSSLAGCFDTAGITAYGDHCFRHIGFSTPLSPVPTATVYFSAPLKNRWPADFEAVRAIVREESQVLHREVQQWIAQTVVL